MGEVSLQPGADNADAGVGTQDPRDNLLLPEYYPQHDLFLCDVADAVLKDDMASMEHPVFSLSKKPDKRIRTYTHNGRSIEITPSVKGLATIYDKDILIYCISQLVAKMNRGQAPQRRIRFVAKELLMFTNRLTSGRHYELLHEALARLAGTRITTNIETGGDVIHEGFGLIENYEVVRSEKSGRILEITIELSRWVFNAIKNNEVLTLHRDYFRLRRPIERRVYEIARKHCGQQDEWQISFSLLMKKTGSRSSTHEFRRLIRELVEGNHLPDYAVFIEDDTVVFRNREQWWKKQELADSAPKLATESYHDAKTVAPTYDVYWLEQEWRDMWDATGRPPLLDPDAAFIAFCKKRYQKRPNP